MSPSDIVVIRILFCGDVRTELLSAAECYPFPACSSSLFLSGCTGGLDRAGECCYHANMCQALNIETKATATHRPPYIRDHVQGKNISQLLSRGLEKIATTKIIDHTHRLIVI